MIKAACERIRVWRPSDLRGLELRRGTGVADPYPRHWHEEFQLCLIQAGGGELSYRRVSHLTPADSLFVVHPGEVHANHALAETGCSFRTLYVSPDLVRRVASQANGRKETLPFFPDPMIFDRTVLKLFLDLHISLERPGSTLERESLLIDLLALLITRYSDPRRPGLRAGSEREAVKRVREYLTEHYAQNLSLSELARIANLSPFHLNRVFRHEVGMPPHAFQTQARIVQAKKLLRLGCPISRVAAQTGFADQSHFSRHFKRLMIIPPARYQRSKNVQDIGDAMH